MAKKENNEDGVWRTIKGRKVFIKDGQSLQDAMKESGKFNNTKTEVKKDNNKIDDDKKKKEDEEETEEELDKKYDEAHQKEEKNDDAGKYDDNYRGNDYWELQEMYEDGSIDSEDVAMQLKEMYKNETGIKKAYNEITGKDLETSEDKADTKEATTDDPRSQITSDDLDNDVNFKITGKDGSTNYINAFWSWNDIDEEDIPEGENLEDWRGIAYNILDENGEEIDGGMMITDQENFNAEDLCKDLAEMSGYSRDMQVSRIDDGDYEEAIENDKSNKTEDVKKENDDYDYEDSDYSSLEDDWVDLIDELKNGNISEDEFRQRATKDVNMDDISIEREIQKNNGEHPIERDRDVQDLFDQLNGEGSDFMFSDPKVESDKITTDVSVFMPGDEEDGGGLVTRELEIPRDKFETYESLEEKMRDWQSRHRYVEDWDNPDFEAEEENKSDKSSNNEGTPNYDKYSADEQDILDGFGEDYGWDNPNKLENLKEQIDYMRNPGESIRQAARRYATGGSGTMLIYTGDAEDYLKERGIKYDKDDPYSTYADVMAEKIEKLYNDASNQTMNNAIREKASKNNQETANGLKLLKARKNEAGTETEDLINQYNQYAKEGKGSPDTYKSLKKQIAENRKANKSTNEKAKEFLDTYEMNDAEYESFAKQVVSKNSKGWPYNKISLWPNKEGKYNPETDKWEFIGMKGIPNGQQSTKIEVDRDGNIYEEGKLAYDNTLKTMSGKYDYKIAPSDNAKVSTTRSKQNQSTNETMNDNIRKKAKKKK